MSKIFLIGHGKTGTDSVHRAMLRMGIKSCHDHIVCNAVVRAVGQDEQHPALDEFEAFTDGSEKSRLWHCLVKDFPDAKFILTLRNEEDWVISRMIHVLRNRVMKYNVTWRDLDTKKELRRYRKHNQMVEDLLGGWTNFLKLEVSEEDSLARLAMFLGKDIPDGMTEMPRANQGNDKLLQIVKARRIKLPDVVA